MTLNKKTPTIIIYSITVIVLISLIFFIKPENIISSLVRLGVPGLSLLILLYIIDLIVRVFRWSLLLQVQGVNLPLKTLTIPVVSALAVNLFLPARAGESIRIFSLKRNNKVNYSDTISSIVIEQILSVFGLLIVIIGILFLIGESLQGTENSTIIQQLVLLLFVISVITLLGLWLAIIKPELIKKMLHLFPSFLEKRLLSMYKSFQTGLKDLKSSPSILSLGILTSASIWIIEGIMLFIIAVGVFPTYGLIDLPYVIAASCVGNITFIIPILPGAMGQYEVAIGIILVSAPGYSFVQQGAFLIAFTDRLIKSAILLILGGYATLNLGGSELLRLKKDIYLTTTDQNDSNKDNGENTKSEILELQVKNKTTLLEENY